MGITIISQASSIQNNLKLNQHTQNKCHIHHIIVPGGKDKLEPQANTPEGLWKELRLPDALEEQPWNAALGFQLPFPFTPSSPLSIPLPWPESCVCTCLPCLHALACNLSFFLNKSFLVTKHQVKKIVQLTGLNNS